jgi:hypothetical protein
VLFGGVAIGGAGLLLAAGEHDWSTVHDSHVRGVFGEGGWAELRDRTNTRALADAWWEAYASLALVPTSLLLAWRHPRIWRWVFPWAMTLLVSSGVLWVYPYWHNYYLIHVALPMTALVAPTVALTARALWGLLRILGRRRDNEGSDAGTTGRQRMAWGLAAVLVTGALPYANGPIHLGHLVEYVQADIYVRFLKSCGVDAIYLCADDTHGTPIELNAAKQGLTPEAFIARWYESHQADFRDFQVAFDHYGSTDNPANRRLCGEVWQALSSKSLIVTRDVQQLYDATAGTFLADRFVKGTCPRCRAADQYGDTCEQCGATYSPADLVDPVSTLSGARPEVRSA